jgi:hypothetical protein
MEIDNMVRGRRKAIVNALENLRGHENRDIVKGIRKGLGAVFGIIHKWTRLQHPPLPFAAAYANAERDDPVGVYHDIFGDTSVDMHYRKLPRTPGSGAGVTVSIDIEKSGKFWLEVVFTIGYSEKDQKAIDKYIGEPGRHYCNIQLIDLDPGYTVERAKRYKRVLLHELAVYKRYLPRAPVPCRIF